MFRHLCLNTNKKSNALRRIHLVPLKVNSKFRSGIPGISNKLFEITNLKSEFNIRAFQCPLISKKDVFKKLPSYFCSPFGLRKQFFCVQNCPSDQH